MARKDLKGKSILLTGAASGIGRCLATEFASRGTRLFLTDIDESGLTETAQLCKGDAVSVCTRIANLSKSDEVVDLARWAEEESGGLDVLYSNAGVMVGSQVADMEWSDYEWLIAINLQAPVRLTHELLPAMLARGEGHIAATASMTGIVTPPGTAAYGITKAGLISYLEGLRAEVRSQGIDVTAICPGFVRTPLVQNTRYRDATYQGRLNDTPRWIGLTPEKVASCSVRAVERRRGVVYLGHSERFSHLIKKISPALYDRMNALLARYLLDID